METLELGIAQEKLKTLIENATMDQARYVITSEHGSVVLLSQEAYENLMVTLEMLSTPILLDNTPDF